MRGPKNADWDVAERKGPCHSGDVWGPCELFAGQAGGVSVEKKPDITSSKFVLFCLKAESCCCFRAGSWPGALCRVPAAGEGLSRNTSGSICAWTEPRGDLTLPSLHPSSQSLNMFFPWFGSLHSHCCNVHAFPTIFLWRTWPSNRVPSLLMNGAPSHPSHSSGNQDCTCFPGCSINLG